MYKRQALVEAHRVAAAVPLIEQTDDADPLGIGRPDGKAYAAHALNFDQVRPQAFVDVEVRALGHQVGVEVAQCRRKGVGVFV